MSGAKQDVPLTVAYSPGDVDIDALYIALVRNGSEFARSDNVIGDADVSDGSIAFSNFALPDFPGVSRNSADFQVDIVLEATVDDEAQNTEDDDVFVTLEGVDAFTPLYLADDVLPNQRTGGRDLNSARRAGGDSWAQTRMIDFLSADMRLLFNDVSAQHVAKAADGDSILGHTTHNDGLAVDVRYLRADGTASSSNAGEANTQRVKRAFEEFRSGGTATADQQELVDWIRVNRTFIASLTGSTRKINVAFENPHTNRGDKKSSDGGIGKALLFGQYIDGAEIVDPLSGNAVGSWNVNTDDIDSFEGHDTHFHIAID